MVERGRVAASVVGVAISVTLVLLLVGMYHGFERASTAYIDQAGADVWVAQRGSIDMFHSVSLLPDSVPGEIEKVGGVGSASPLVARTFHAHIAGVERDLYVIGFDVSTGVGGPRAVVQGSAAVSDNDIIIATTLAQESGISLGSIIRLADRDFTVVGITEIRAASVWSYAFIDFATARDAFKMAGSANYVLVRTNGEAAPDDVAREIEKTAPGTTAIASDDFAAANGRTVRELFVPILLVVGVVGFLIGLAVIFVSTWSGVMEHLPEYAVLKALGASPRMLGSTVVTQSAATALMGFVVGVPVYLMAAAALEGAVPRIGIATDWSEVAGAFVALVATAALAAYLPIKRIEKLDPARVFRGGW